MPSDDVALRHAIIEFYRAEMDHRYRLENVRQFENFDDVPDEQVDALRDYFMAHIYPPVERRDVLDDAINRLGDVMKSPMRLRPLMGTALRSMWRLGPSLPSAVSTGVAVLDAYQEARKLERIMVETAHEIGVTAADSKRRERMLLILSEVPESDVRRLIRDILKLFHALSNTKMLKTAVDFLDTCTGIMRSKPELYPPSEIEGISLGRDMVQGGLDLFEQLERDQFPRIIDGIEQVEWDWYYSVTGRSAEA